MKLVDNYNAYIEDYKKNNNIDVMNPVEWIESNLIEMGESIALSDLQRHIVKTEKSLLNRHIPRRRGKSFAVFCSAIYKAVVLKQTCLYVGPNSTSARYAKTKVIELLRSSSIAHIHATDYVRIGEGRIYFTTANDVQNNFRGVHVDCVFLDETMATSELEMAMPLTSFVTVGSSSFS